jgi:hypothetical protein
MVLRGSAGLRCRRHRWLYFGDEGSRGPQALPPAGNIASGAGGGMGEMSGEARRNRSKILGCFGTEGAALLDTWPPRTCKEVTVRGGDKGCRVYRCFRPYEDALEACTTRGVTVIPL